MDRFRNEGWHVLGQDRSGRAVIKYNEILGGQGGIKRVSSELRKGVTAINEIKN